LARGRQERVEVITYDRLSPLEVEHEPLFGRYKMIMPGDCIVAFSKKKVRAIKSVIESERRMKCAMIYGSMPPEVRSKQADLFNDPHSPFKVLVATDAIGLGLNLNIKRIIFHELQLFDGLKISSQRVKQIAGRAGRFGREKYGRVTTFKEGDDFEYLHECMSLMPEEYKKAGLLPQSQHYLTLHERKPNLKLSEMMVTLSIEVLL
jgi:ATP-dependent RNA helicase SUPV3L1/SUV3